MTKKEIKTVAFNLIKDYVIKGHDDADVDRQTIFMCRAFSIVEMLAELNMLTDSQIKDIEDEIYGGYYI